MKASLPLLSLLLGLSSPAMAGDAFSFDRIEFTSIRDAGANPDYLTVHARVCLFYNIYTNKNNEVPVNCSIPLPYSPILKESEQAKAAEAELELSIWQPAKSPKKVEREFLKIKSAKLISGALDDRPTRYEIEAQNSRYHVKMVTTYSLRTKDGGEDLVLQPSDEPGSNTMTVTAVVSGELAKKPLLVSKEPSVIVTSLGEDQ